MRRHHVCRWCGDRPCLPPEPGAPRCAEHGAAWLATPRHADGRPVAKLIGYAVGELVGGLALALSGDMADAVHWLKDADHHATLAADAAAGWGAR